MSHCSPLALLWLLPLLLPLVSCSPSGGLELEGLAADGMVVQQRSVLTLRGRAWPGSRIEASADWGEVAYAQASADSTWLLTIATPAADTMRHALNVRCGEQTRRLRDILVGEVWLVLGQFDMLVPAAGWGPDRPADADRLLRKPVDPLLRSFIVLPGADYVPHDRCVGSWSVCDSLRLTQLGAAGLAFAQTLRDSLGVPVGIVQAAFGGTPLRSWVSPERQAQDSVSLDKERQRQHDKVEKLAYRAYLDSLPQLPIYSPEGHDLLPDLTIADAQVMLAGCEFNRWPTMAVPGYWDGELEDFDGVVWFHRRVVVPPAWVGSDLKLHLGVVDDRDRTYVNNYDVGGFRRQGAYDMLRTYRVPAEAVKDTVMDIVVRVTDEYGGGGLAGYPFSDLPMRLTRCRPTAREQESAEGGEGEPYVGIEGEWHYWVAAQFEGNRLVFLSPRPRPDGRQRFRALPHNQRLPTMVYNSMLLPLRHLRVAGCLTSVCEGDYIDPEDLPAVADYLPRYIGTLRDLFGERLPVFLAEAVTNLDQGGGQESPVGAVRLAVNETRRHLPGVKLVGCLDLSLPIWQHSDGQTCEGRRFAAMALDVVYGRDGGDCAGPQLVRTTAKGDVVTLHFSHAAGLHLSDGSTTGVELAGPDSVWHPAKLAELAPPTLSVFSYLVADPQRLRYGTDNVARAYILGAADAPAPAFERAVNERLVEEEY